MSRQFLWTVLVFVIALGSGIVIGRNLPHGESPHHGERSWLADELKLTPDQQEKMKAIWQEVLPGRGGGPGGPGAAGGAGGRHGDPRRQLSSIYKERDEAIAALIPSDRRADYDKIIAHTDQQIAELGREREKAVQKAVEETKAILNPDQRVKYEELLKKGPFGPRRPGTSPSATQPAGQ